MDYNIYRTASLDYKKAWENIVTGVADYLNEFGIQSMILGVSGGIDSTVVAAICCEVSKRTGKPLFGLSLMTESNADDEMESALAVGHEFCTRYSVTHMQSEYETMSRLCNDISERNTNLTNGNIKARMRMMILFDASAKEKGIVLGGSNLTEVMLGYFTRGADDVSGLAPICGLWKHEVYGLAHWIKDNIYPDSVALEKSIALTPTDGNGVLAGGDLAQIAPGATYEVVDDILMRYVYANLLHPAGTVTRDKVISDVVDRCYELYGEGTTSKVIHRHLNSQFKRYYSPVHIDIFNGTTVDMNDNIIVDGRNTTNKD